MLLFGSSASWRGGGGVQSAILDTPRDGTDVDARNVCGTALLHVCVPGRLT
jgi:hypothetical protein